VVGNTWRAVQGEGDGIVGSNPMVESNRVVPSYGAGTPFLAGRYEVITTPSWSFTGTANQGTAIGDGESGSTTVSWPSMADAPYKAKLTLANSWGSDSREVEMIDAAVKLDEAGEVIEDLSVYPNPFAESLYIRFIEKGEYEMEVFNLAGQKVQSKLFGVEKYETVSLNLSGEAGMYIVRLKKDGKYIKSFKLEKK
ncbi:MAG: T9SS type A sorting domain-containing protein, partial [Paludibacteraceae bacterium]|nr:T9SS type A sorting domain-containing protein [Paludibacteraceae bacterium]